MEPRVFQALFMNSKFTDGADDHADEDDDTVAGGGCGSLAAIVQAVIAARGQSA